MPNVKNVVSMLVQETKIMLFTAEGQVLDFKMSGPHDTASITAYLNERLNGTNVVEIDLEDYLVMKKALTPASGEGMVITTIIDGKEVQGIFYPQQMDVSVEHEGENLPIPNIGNLARHAQRAVDTNSPAIRNFLKRLAPIIKERKHSAEDLMAFIERSDLPLTHDGKIIGYKKVNRKNTSNGEVFVDVHSGKVEQRLGSRVWMEAEKVDPSRTNSCSNGLHVANLGYLSGFSGSHTLIVLVDPADFIAVPHGETNKARVCSYDIIGVMSAGSHKVTSSGEHVKGDHTLESIIKDAINGNHVKPFERIQVGDKCVLGRTRIESVPVPEDFEKASATTTTNAASLNEDQTSVKGKEVLSMTKQTKTGTDRFAKLDPMIKAVFDDLHANKYESKTALANAHGTSTRTIGRWQDKYNYDAYVRSLEGTMTVADRARQLFNQGAMEALAAFKKAKKKSYNALGFTQQEENKILAAVS